MYRQTFTIASGESLTLEAAANPTYSVDWRCVMEAVPGASGTMTISAATGRDAQDEDFVAFDAGLLDDGNTGDDFSVHTVWEQTPPFLSLRVTADSADAVLNILWPVPFGMTAIETP